MWVNAGGRVRGCVGPPGLVGGRPVAVRGPMATNLLRTGFYSGTFDPVTLGHLDVIQRSLRLVDRLVIGIGIHPGKAPVFTVEERIEMLKSEVKPLLKRSAAAIDVVTFANLTVDAAREAGASMILRGLRDATDFDYEMQMSGMNGAMAEDIDTVFLPASPDVRHITATHVRQIAMMGGDVARFVSPSVAKRLAAKAKAGAKRG
jgi:pantetheine-phosphate adenylyltransferase